MRRLGVFAVALVATLAFASAALAKQPYPLNYTTFGLGPAGGGTTSGLTYTVGQLELGSPLTPFQYTDLWASVPVLGQTVNGSGMYESGTWTSAWTHLNFPFSQLVSSWNSHTPEHTWIQSRVRVRFDGGHETKWYVLGQWSYSDSDFHRTSVGGQGDADGFVSIDTWIAKDHLPTSYQLELTLLRRPGAASPTVSRYSAVASDLTNQKMNFPSAWGGLTKDLGLPQYSQETHHGHWPEFDNGGEAWCSPTSTSMVVAYWDRGSGLYAPQPAEMTWVDAGIPAADRPDADPQVDYTARFVYDYHYQGAGNWPFNVAYASERGLAGDVTQLHNLAEAEPFIQDGIPLVASVAWESNKLTGGIKSTNGHLLVIGGFDEHGNVIAYDPASPTDAEVRHVYDREEFERAWIPASGGTVYVIRPRGHALPSLTDNNS